MTTIDRSDKRCDKFYHEDPVEGKCYGSLRANLTETTVDCDECGRHHQRLFSAEPPFYFDMMTKPSGNPKFCPSHNMNSKKGNLTDFCIRRCGAIHAPAWFGNMRVSVTAKELDLYMCSYCHKEFEAKCIHGIY